MTAEQLFEQIKLKQSFLCIGLDTEMEKLPDHLKNNENAVYEFNKQIIDETHDLVIAYKPNIAFYECLGASGWRQLELTVNYIKERFPDIMVIADAKRGDIGNTSKKYAETFFKLLKCDAITIAPYMGSDSIAPFLLYPGKWVIILALTSNQGAEDFQYLRTNENERLFETVLYKTSAWGNNNNIMYVVGATRSSMFIKIREIVPHHFLLVPGIGAQGGDLYEVAKYGMNSKCGLIVNSSRAIIYADSTRNFAKVARIKAKEVQQSMQSILKSI